jgi:hypothetical protein
MNEPIEFTLPPDVFKALGSLCSTPKNILSPFEANRTLDKTQMGALQKEALLDGGGQPKPAVSAVLEALAAPSAYSELRLFATPAYREHAVFCNVDATRRVMLTTTGADVLVSDPAPLEELIASVQEYVGTSTLRAPTFAAELDYAQAIALAAMIDLHRRAGFRVLADQAEFTPPAFDARAVADTILQTGEDVQWLVGIMKMLGSHDQLPTIEFNTVLDRLVSAGHISQAGSQYQLGDAAALLAGRLLVIDLVMLLDAGQLTANDEVTATHLLCLQAGVHDLLTIETYDSTVRFECLSAAAVMECVKMLLTQSHKLAHTVKPTECPRCHAATHRGSRFCAMCGLPLTA